MNGAESLVHTLLEGGVDVCFANPGTSEMHFVAALDRIEGMRCVLCLFEGVVSGAADGYARMTGRPAATLLHLGPGLGNALANLHNAKKARSPIVNVVGEHATYHIQYNTPLTSDIAGIARPVSGWVDTASTPESVGPKGAEAIAAARTAPGQVATLILPGDAAWTEGGVVGKVPTIPERDPIDATQVDQAAQALRGAGKSLLLLGAGALFEAPLELAGRIAAATSCDVMAEGMNTRLQRGAGRLAVNRIPYPVDQGLETLAPYQRIVLIGAGVPAVFFAYPNKPSLLAPEHCQTLALARPDQDCQAALQALADAVGARPGTARLQQPERPQRPSGPMTLEAIASAIGALLPENAVVVDESITTGRNFYPFTCGAPPHDWLQNRGGSIGIGLPMATGAAIACPDRKVICLESDGSAMYNPQALWTQAREGLNVTTLVFANRAYNILRGELRNVGAQNPGPRANDMLSLDRPTLDFVALAKSMGIEAVRVDNADDLYTAFERGLSIQGPAVIEVVI
ncbi:MAG: acetolactate synthase large subunit [Gammaproteobacteria bacterium]|nr:acetolactate synthase large subunit [Gammaproteobacteria bacterium]